MPENSKLTPPTNEQVNAFLGLKTHAEKCAHFHKPENANLRLVFGEIHFPKPDDNTNSGSTV
jgi:hypothetical protein